MDVWECVVVACQAVANIVKSSLGPVGLDKVFFFSLLLRLCCGDLCLFVWDVWWLKA